ncbi:MAG: HDOD domain-containing protein [Bacillota bacterium]
MKKRVLFVDDERNIIEGFRRMTRVMRDSWEVYFAEGGEDALKFLSEHTVDVIVSDMRMPGMTGAELLTIVMERFPSVIRIVLSGHSDQEMILQSVKCAHQYLLKPCTLDALTNAIERTFITRDLLSDESLVKLVTGVKNLPSLPSLYSKLIDVLRSENASLKRVGDIISQDLIMSAKILRIVNSAFFSLPQKITSPHQATAFLGLDVIKSLVIQVELFSVFNSSSRKNLLFLENLWKHCMEVGNLAKEIAGTGSTEKKVQEDALISGMLHDIGKLLLLDIPDYLSKINDLTKNKKCPFWEAEYELFGCSHAEVGGYLLSLWGFSDPIVEAVAFHHKPLKSMNLGFSALSAVHMADAFTRKGEADRFISNPGLLDQKYIELIDKEGKIEEWAAVRNKIKEVDYL